MLKSILVVDDDDRFRGRIARAFRDRGLEVGEAASGALALDYVRASKPELVLLDMKLERESGLDILRRVLEVDSAIRVVVLTGYGTIATAVEAVKLGAVNYLTKPVDADTALSSFFEDKAAMSSKIETPQLDQVEWDHIQRVIQDCDGNITQSAKILGMHRRSLQRKLGKNPSQLR